MNMQTRFSRHVVAFGIALAAAAAVRCGDSPTPPTTTTTTAPVQTNTPPVIASVTVSALRVEANDEVQLTANVTDAETPIDQLTYQWSASVQGGTFTGTGRQVSWRAPVGAATPDTVTFTLTVTENYTSSGQPKQNTATNNSASVHYNDSKKEVGDIATLFLTEFATNDLDPVYCVRNFSDSCSGKQDELSDVQKERRDVTALGSDLSIISVNLTNADRTTATTEINCVFYDIPKSGPNAGRRERVPGICTLTAVYESFRWWLCTSTFRFNGEPTPYGSYEYHVPGRITEMPPLSRPY